MKQKQKLLNWQVKSALRKRDNSWLNWKRHKSNLLIYHKMRNNATNIKREAKMLEECKVIERIKENKNNFYKFVSNKTKRREQFVAIQKQDGTFIKCDQETAEVLNSEFQKVFTKTGLLTKELKDLLQNKSVCSENVKTSISSEVIITVSEA